MAEVRLLKQPFDPWIDKGCRILILGSFPSVLAVKNGFYYGNPLNRFYEVLGRLLQVDLKALDSEGKRQSLLARHIAVYDVVASCRIVGSNDASMSHVEVAAIDQLIDHTAIQRIFLNGQTAARLFTKHFPTLMSMATALPSTSPANARRSLEDLVEDWRVILAYI